MTINLPFCHKPINLWLPFSSMCQVLMCSIRAEVFSNTRWSDHRGLAVASFSHMKRSEVNLEGHVTPGTLHVTISAILAYSTTAFSLGSCGVMDTGLSLRTGRSNRGGERISPKRPTNPWTAGLSVLHVDGRHRLVPGLGFPYCSSEKQGSPYLLSSAWGASNANCLFCSSVYGIM